LACFTDESRKKLNRADVFLKRFYKVCVVFSARFHTSLLRSRAFFYVFLQDQNECFSLVKVMRS